MGCSRGSVNIIITWLGALVLGASYTNREWSRSSRRITQNRLFRWWWWWWWCGVNRLVTWLNHFESLHIKESLSRSLPSHLRPNTIIARVFCFVTPTRPKKSTWEQLKTKLTKLSGFYSSISTSSLLQNFKAIPTNYSRRRTTLTRKPSRCIQQPEFSRLALKNSCTSKVSKDSSSASKAVANSICSNM